MDRRVAVGIGLVVISAAGYGSGSILAAPIYATGVDWLTLVGWRFMIGAGLGWLWVLASPHRRAALRLMTRRQLAVALGLGALFTGNAGTYYAGLESVPAALAGVVVYTYPVMVAVLSLRFATRLPGRRPWIAAGLAVAGSALALGGIDMADAPPVGGLVLVFLSALIYSVWIILSARLSGERRDRLATDEPRGRHHGRRRGGHDDRDDDRDRCRLLRWRPSCSGGRSIRPSSRPRPGPGWWPWPSSRRSWPSRRSTRERGASGRRGPR